MKIKEIRWISGKEYRLDAEVIVTDGKFEVKCFCNECNFKENDVLSDVLHTLDTDNVMLALTEEFECRNINNTFNHYMVGKLINKELLIVKVGGILIEIDGVPGDIGDINEGQFIEFVCSRIDIY